MIWRFVAKPVGSHGSVISGALVKGLFQVVFGGVVKPVTRKVYYRGRGFVTLLGRRTQPNLPRFSKRYNLLLSCLHIN